MICAKCGEETGSNLEHSTYQVCLNQLQIRVERMRKGLTSLLSAAREKGLTWFADWLRTIVNEEE